MLTELTKGASVTEVAIRLGAAVLFGALLGWDRERWNKPAGIRTHMLVALGSATFTILGFEVGEHYSKEGFDPTRVLQGVVGGIGFLGAGAILQKRGQVSGITTAASVWVAGALGAAAGVGAYVLALVATLLGVGILAGAGKLEQFARRNDGDSSDKNDPGRTSSSPPPKSSDTKLAEARLK
jgi:putative Mg2+ transporter-C (MgtC) family protein